MQAGFTRNYYYLKFFILYILSPWRITMRLRRIRLSKFLFTLFFLITITPSSYALDTVTIGLDLPLSGSLSDLGLESLAGAELLESQINNKGGILVGGKRYPVKFITIDNTSTVEQSVSGALKLISRDKVLGVVGPNASSNAIPVGGICASFKTPMITPTSTNPATTKNRPFVFRSCFLDDFQGEAMAKFAIKEFGAKKAAVLFDKNNAYPKGLAKFFKKAFEEEQGDGSVVSFAAYESNSSDLSPQLAQIVGSEAQVLFLPQYAHELPSILKQIRDAGWDKPILGGDAWESSELMKTCGDLCKGLFFSSHFSPYGAKGESLAFVKEYEKKTGKLPTAFAALGYDATNLLLAAISKLDSLDGNLFTLRADIQKQLTTISGFEGVSGTVNMNTSGDPAKSAVIIRISDDGKFEAYGSVKP
ncbi:MAG: branched-chain amino acid transport system substrate-binding protein [Desulforhopalus sp.]